MRKYFAEYILLETDNGYTTLRIDGDKFYLCLETDTDDNADASMEIDEEAFNTLIQQYIAANGSTPIPR